ARAKRRANSPFCVQPTVSNETREAALCTAIGQARATFGRSGRRSRWAITLGRNVRTIDSAEFSLIRRFASAFHPPPPPRGPGDDGAVLAGPRSDLCVTVDAVVEGVHFTRRHFGLEDIGHKALAVNLSDLAAMGARPTWFLCALAIPKRLGVGPLMAI